MHVVIVACNFHMGFHHLHIYTSYVWSYHNQLFTVHHLGYYSLVSLVFGTTIPTSFNIMKCFLHLFHQFFLLVTILLQQEYCHTQKMQHTTI